MLTQEQIEDFHKNGYLIMRGLFKGRELELLQKAADAVQAEGVARTGSDHRYYTRDGSQTYWRSEKMWQRDDIFLAVTVKQELLENIGQIIGHSFYPWNDSLVVKLANSGAPVHWHQDPPYGARSRSTTFGIPNFTTDIYLDHSGPDNGCVWAIHGRHLVGHVDLKQVSEEDLYNRCGAVPLEMEAGDVLFHCLSTPHGSAFNPSDRQRRIFYIHYLNEEVYQDSYAPEAWAKELPGWSEDRYRLLRMMLDKRVELGFDATNLNGPLRLDENGFSFAGTPVTPPKYWDQLQTQYSEAEREHLKVVRTLNAAR
ncbi:phytanoyl-CoA dioxygenase family protein [Paenibacillus silviterrae]|uniref:phytanoyl-CoA dioxygenase family protein n=1 Tax=Paenibacillus silviterrae TaxID=3242194 RepID=UPI002542ABAD|nr:phytanoyl-CoA dioxygenase family protein [Paenibacillus chinjuensis]